MKKLLLIALSVFMGISAYAQEEVNIYFKGGNVTPGYLKVDGKKFEFRLFGTKACKEQLSLSNVDSVVVKADSSVLIPLKWVECATLPLNKEKDVTLMLRVYQGANIDGYITFAGNHTWTPTFNGNYHSYSEVAKFYYHVRNEKLAYSFYAKVPYDNDKNVRRTIALGMKKTRPELRNYVKSEEFESKTKGIKDTPGMVFPLFDEFFGK
jgi:hypothetical protein